MIPETVPRRRHAQRPALSENSKCTGHREDLVAELMVPPLQWANRERRKLPLTRSSQRGRMGMLEKREPLTHILVPIGPRRHSVVCWRAHVFLRTKLCTEVVLPLGNASSPSLPRTCICSEFHPWLLCSFSLHSDLHLCSFSHPLHVSATQVPACRFIFPPAGGNTLPGRLQRSYPKQADDLQPPPSALASR